MGDPVTLAIIGTVASAGIGAYSSMKAGEAQAQAASFERAQYENQRTMTKIQALDEENDRRRRLQQVLASNRAQEAAFGVGSDGRSFLAVQSDSTAQAERDIGRIRLNAASSMYTSRLAADQASVEASSARTSGFTGAATSLLGGGIDAYKLKKG